MKTIYSFPLIKQLIQALGRSATKYCNKCGSNRFDLILDNIFGIQDELCLNCRTQAKFMKQLLFRWFNYFEIDSETVKNICADISIRKVIKNFFKGLAIFGLRKPMVLGAPLSVVWNLTNKCNLKCSHCFVDANFNEESENELSTEEAKQVIDNLAANDVVTVNFCGGEPFTRDDIFELMKYTKENDIYPSVSTNATLLSKKNCHEVFDAGVRSITISLDSYSPKNHDHLRQVSGAFEMAVNGIKNAVEFGKFDDIIINTTLLDYNYHEIPKIYDFVKELGATGFYVSRILPTGRGKTYFNHDPNNEIKIEVMKFMAKKFIQSVRGNDEISVLGRGMPYYSRTCYELSKGTIYPLCELLTGFEPKYKDLFNGKIVNLIQYLSCFFSGCATGLFYCGLNCEGMVIPCAPAGHIKLGNILQKGLKDIWINNPILNQIRERDKVTGKCLRCREKHICGGCRLTAHGLTGSWLKSDLSCPF